MVLLGWSPSTGDADRGLDPVFKFQPMDSEV